MGAGCLTLVAAGQRWGVGPASSGVPAGRAGATLAELGELVLVGVEDPAVGWGGLLAAVDPAAAQPGVQGDRWHAQLGGQVVQPPLVGAGCLAGRWGGAGAVAGGWVAQLAQELADRGNADAVAALGGAEALGVEASGDGVGAVAVLGELADAAQELRVGGELVQAGDRADSLAVGGVAAGPGDRDRDAFAAAWMVMVTCSTSARMSCLRSRSVVV